MYLPPFSSEILHNFNFVLCFRLSLVESIPEGHMYPPNATHLPTKNVWLDLIDEAQTSIEIASLYWTLRFNEDYHYNSSIEVSLVVSLCFHISGKKGRRSQLNQKFAISIVKVML